MALNASGQGALVHDRDSRALLLEAASWSLASAKEPGEPGTVALSGARSHTGQPVDGGYRPVRIVLPWGQRFLVVHGELADGDGEGRYEVLLTSLPVPDANALDDWESPVAQEVPLPNGHRWRVRTHPRRGRLEQWHRLLTTDGPTPESWHELLVAYDGGWTLDGPSPAAMPDAGGWDGVPLAVVETVGDFLAYTAAEILRDRFPSGAEAVAA